MDNKSNLLFENESFVDLDPNGEIFKKKVSAKKFFGCSYEFHILNIEFPDLFCTKQVYLNNHSMQKIDDGMVSFYLEFGSAKARDSVNRITIKVQHAYKQHKDVIIKHHQVFMQKTKVLVKLNLNSANEVDNFNVYELDKGLDDDHINSFYLEVGVKFSNNKTYTKNSHNFHLVGKKNPTNVIESYLKQSHLNTTGSSSTAYSKKSAVLANKFFDCSYKFSIVNIYFPDVFYKKEVCLNNHSMQRINNDFVCFLLEFGSALVRDSVSSITIKVQNVFKEHKNVIIKHHQNIVQEARVLVKLDMDSVYEVDNFKVYELDKNLHDDQQNLFYLEVDVKFSNEKICTNCSHIFRLVGKRPLSTAESDQKQCLVIKTDSSPSAHNQENAVIVSNCFNSSYKFRILNTNFPDVSYKKQDLDSECEDNFKVYELDKDLHDDHFPLVGKRETLGTANINLKQNLLNTTDSSPSGAVKSDLNQSCLNTADSSPSGAVNIDLKQSLLNKTYSSASGVVNIILKQSLLNTTDSFPSGAVKSDLNQSCLNTTDSSPSGAVNIDLKQSLLNTTDSSIPGSVNIDLNQSLSNKTGLSPSGSVIVDLNQSLSNTTGLSPSGVVNINLKQTLLNSTDSSFTGSVNIDLNQSLSNKTGLSPSAIDLKQSLLNTTDSSLSGAVDNDLKQSLLNTTDLSPSENDLKQSHLNTTDSSTSGVVQSDLKQPHLSPTGSSPLVAYTCSDNDKVLKCSKLVMDHVQTKTLQLGNLFPGQTIQTTNGDVIYHWPLKNEDEQFEEGEIVGFNADLNGKYYLRKLTLKNCSKALLKGVICRSYNLQSQVLTDGRQRETICMMGIVPVKVKGSVCINEALYTSPAFPGFAVSSYHLDISLLQSSAHIGYAFSSQNGADEKVEGMVKAGVSVLESATRCLMDVQLRTLKSQIDDVSLKQKRKERCIYQKKKRYTSIYFLAWIVLAILSGVFLYHIFVSGASFKYFLCKQGRLIWSAFYQFIPIHDTGVHPHIRGTEFEPVFMQKAAHAGYKQLNMTGYTYHWGDFQESQQLI
ncbi:uncharacterized protein LOC105845470 [Hydra vulgaris]|uniref:uncharacterized protein LOC105845470 n=1 Tax=Hydra vulgaris TaxID=6087 RepID=UPI0032EA15AC